MPGVRRRILQVMADAVACALTSFDERTGRFLSKPEGAPAPGAKPEDLGWGVINQDSSTPWRCSTPLRGRAFTVTAPS